ncbi:MAG: hypothetical protein WD359_05180 [Dehalococcoidia bacterium]
MTSERVDPAALRARFYEQLLPAARLAVDRLVAEASRRGAVYMAGGIPRDLILGRPIGSDVDLVTEADAMEIARAAGPAESLTMHDRFRTATMEGDGHRIDVATARRETYARPGALPDVHTASIEDDMRRRDVTMNAMALRLDGEPALVDPAGGCADIDARIIRVLHDASFRDDATRIFRAFRYAARLDCVIEPHTQSLVAAGVRFIETLSGERVRHELQLLCADTNGGRALAQLDRVGALSAIHAALRWPERKSSALEAPNHDQPEICLALLASDASAEQAEEIVERLQLSKAEAEAVRGIVALRAAATMIRRPDVKPSGVVTVLERFLEASIEAFAALSDDEIVRSVMRRYLDEWRLERPLLNGHDLIGMGVPEGPQIKRGLQLIRAARLDGWATDRDDERALVLRFAKSIRDSRAMNQPIDFKLYEN